MTETTIASGTTEAGNWSPRALASGGALAAIIALGDFLFWANEPGISFFIFFFGLSLAIVALHPQRWRAGQTVALFVVALLAAAPIVEALSPFAFVIALGGVGLLAIGISGQLPQFEDWLGTAVRFAVLAPLRLADDGLGVLIGAGRQKVGGHLLRGVVAWIVPLVFALVFVMLFAAANPVVEYGLRAIRLDTLLELVNPGRLIFWGVLAFIAWPFLAPKLLRWTGMAEMHGPALPRAESLLFGSTAIRNSLIVFNAMFAVQTVLDLMFLWGGVRLPDGMSHAEYAHRGAYPLIVTAILAGLFVLAAMRRDGAGRQSPLIRGLVYLWIAQNVWLVVSSVLRLKLYVEIYTLSEMRIAAFIWMGLVAVGLVLIVVKIVMDRTNKWLVVSNLAVLTATLWAVSWVDLQGFIAQYNVRHAYEVTGEGVPLDFYHTADLGAAAVPALDEFLSTARHASDSTLKEFRLLREELASRAVVDEGWRNWSWREDRLRQYLGEHPFAPESGKAID
ncbi:MAG: DUF4173 domain-containing protein [Hyphomicrobiales bacterium]|nr:MAG: DUF4173 domain-containing protein [Hyphomicrobiales bacterium]